MPALTAYTPYETLVFFQNVAELGADKSSLQEISTTLNSNQLIREHEKYDVSKLAPDALQSLYDRIVSENKSHKSSSVNGEALSNGTGPVKRETSPSPTAYLDHEQFIQNFADKLYAQFREQAIRELRQQEREYGELQVEITKLTTQIEDEQAGRVETAEESKQQKQSPSAHVSVGDPAGAQLQTELSAARSDINPPQAHPSSASNLSALPDQPQPTAVTAVTANRTGTPRSASGTPVPRPVAPLVSQASQHHSPGSFNRTQPPPSPQRSSYGPGPPTHNYPPHQPNASQPHMLPPIQNLQRASSNEGYSRPSSQGRGSPMPQYTPSYPHYPPYPQAPHAWHSNGPQQYPQPPYQGQHYPVPQNMYTQVQTPHQPTYPGYPTTAPIPYPPQQWQHPHSIPHYQYPASANTTPVHRSHAQVTITRSASSTPWKSRSTPIGYRPRSPSRLDREISPLSDNESPEPTSPRRQPRFVKKSLPHAVSTTDLNPSRSHSVVSNASEAPDPPKRKVGRPPKIKTEVPTTPAALVPTASDAEQTQRSSGRRGRPRASIASVNVSEQLKSTPTLKRKREGPSSSPAPRHESFALASETNDKLNLNHMDGNYVIVSKTFGKTSQILLNDITSHKRAGIFAKPLTERDAPSYKNEIHRPQDLKSIKAAISKGSRAAIAAIDELESDITMDESGTGSTPTGATAPTSSSVAGPIGNGFYLVQANEDLLPPKGIVNSSQLEVELVRMFANAVMFNPLPSSERGFGRSLRLRKRGGALPTHGARRTTTIETDADVEANQGKRDASESTVATAAESSSSSDSPASDSVIEHGGIIADAREMFEDVAKSVSRWKDLEGGKIIGVGGSQQQGTTVGGSFAERHASVSASSVAGDDVVEGDGSAFVGATGSMRKRRRVGDH